MGVYNSTQKSCTIITSKLQQKINRHMPTLKKRLHPTVFEYRVGEG